MKGHDYWHHSTMFMNVYYKRILFNTKYMYIEMESLSLKGESLSVVFRVHVFVFTSNGKGFKHFKRNALKIENL